LSEAATNAATDTQPEPRVLFGVPIDPLTLEQTLDRAESAIRSRSRLALGVVNAAKIVKLRADAELRRSVLESDLILPDGASVVWAGKILGRNLPERVAGIDIFECLLGRADKGNFRVYFLGSRQEVLDKVVERATRENPGLIVAGARDGYFSDEEFKQAARDVIDAKPDVLFVAMTTPKKENFLREVARAGLVPVTHGVGGSFDVYASKTKRAPKWMQSAGLEWLYRVYQEPRRMWKRYAVTNTVFAFLVFRELIRRSPRLEFEAETEHARAG